MNQRRKTLVALLTSSLPKLLTPRILRLWGSEAAVVGVSGDLVLYCESLRYTRDYFIYNPYTAKVVGLPRPCRTVRHVPVGFICDPIYEKHRDNVHGEVISLNFEYRCKVVRILPDNIGECSYGCRFIELIAKDHANNNRADHEYKIEYLGVPQGEGCLQMCVLDSSDNTHSVLVWDLKQELITMADGAGKLCSKEYFVLHIAEEMEAEIFRTLVYNRLTVGMVKVGKVNNAIKSFFDLMVKKLKMDIPSYQFIMKAFSDAGKFDEVLNVVGIWRYDQCIALNVDRLQEFIEGELRKDGREDVLGKLIEEKERLKAEAEAKYIEEVKAAKRSRSADVSYWYRVF
ncbi:hypothetical protein M0R45_007613 [Rubus argutus]|uniref:Uncharacterized protein n=1 Tax=Rubus argutus TaxID=59490 RepID=A0AAW1XYS2_RUBAR